MQLPQQINLLQKQLNIPSDKVNLIIPQTCHNFIKKYERTININTKTLTNDLRHIMQEIQIYAQYTYDVVNKYQCLDKLSTLFRSIVQGQNVLLNFMVNIATESVHDKLIYETKLQKITNRIYQRCQNCSRPIQSALITSTQNQIGMKFRDLFEYFMQDMQQLNKLSEQASLIFRKKALNIEGITEQEYMQKFQKMYENISYTIQHVTSSLANITLFQQKFNQIQENQYILSKTDKQRREIQGFNVGKYKLNITKHFYGKIKNLQQKINKINHYFIPVHSIQTQTLSQFSQSTPQRLKQLKQIILNLQIQKKQNQIYTSSLQKQLSQHKTKLINEKQVCAYLKGLKQKLEAHVKVLEMELQVALFNVNKNKEKEGISNDSVLGRGRKSIANSNNLKSKNIVNNGKQKKKTNLKSINKFSQPNQEISNQPNSSTNNQSEPYLSTQHNLQERQFQNPNYNNLNSISNIDGNTTKNISMNMSVGNQQYKFEYEETPVTNRRQSKNTYLVRKQPITLQKFKQKEKMKDSGVVLAKKGFSNDIMNLNLNTSTKMANNNAVSNIKSTAVPQQAQQKQQKQYQKQRHEPMQQVQLMQKQRQDRKQLDVQQQPQQQQQSQQLQPQLRQYTMCRMYEIAIQPTPNNDSTNRHNTGSNDDNNEGEHVDDGMQEQSTKNGLLYSYFRERTNNISKNTASNSNSRKDDEREKEKRKDKYKYRHISNRYKHVMQELYKDIVVSPNTGSTQPADAGMKDDSSNNKHIKQYISYQQFVDTFQELVSKLISNYRSRNSVMQTRKHSRYNHAISINTTNNVNMENNITNNANNNAYSNSHQPIFEPDCHNNFDKRKTSAIYSLSKLNLENPHSHMGNSRFFNLNNIHNTGNTDLNMEIKYSNMNTLASTNGYRNRSSVNRDYQHPLLQSNERQFYSQSEQELDAAFNNNNGENYMNLLLKAKSKNKSKLNTQSNSQEPPNSKQEKPSNGKQHIKIINRKKDNNGKHMSVNANYGTPAYNILLEGSNSNNRNQYYRNSLLQNLPILIKKNNHDHIESSVFVHPLSYTIQVHKYASNESPPLNQPYLRHVESSLLQMQKIYQEMKLTATANHSCNNNSNGHGKGLQRLGEGQSFIQDCLLAFTQTDVKIIYHSVENALCAQKSISYANHNIHANSPYHTQYTLSKKHKKTQSSLNPIMHPSNTHSHIASLTIMQRQTLTSIQIQYIKLFFTKMAYIHLVDKDMYEKVKQFLVCPYDLVVSQATQLGFVKMSGADGSGTSAMKQALKNILILHRMCVQKGQLCKHLKYFLGKISYIQKRRQRQTIRIKQKQMQMVGLKQKYTEKQKQREKSKEEQKQNKKQIDRLTQKQKGRQTNRIQLNLI